MFRLDYLSCLLTVASTLLVGRKIWIGLVIGAINSAIVCVIGVHTAQYGFIPANVFCIIIYAWSVCAWRRDRKLAREANDARTEAALERNLPRRNAVLRPRRGHTGLFLAYNANSDRRQLRRSADDLIATASAVEVKAGR